MAKIRRKLVFFGYVQGVGFRYRAKHTAERLGVTGWVENCYDGSVEMEAEGDENAVNRLVLAMREHSWGEVTEVRAKDIPLAGDRYFEIR